MATAMEIYKLLPKKNCGECKFPTCLAFAMQLANKKAALNDCPYVDEKVKATLADSAAPPIRLVKFGGNVGELAIGDETEMFRHDKKFYHQTVLSLRVKDTASEADQKKAIEHAASLTFERVGQKMKLDAIVLQNSSGQSGPLEALARHAMTDCKLPVIILGDRGESIGPAARVCKERRPLIGIANKGNLDAMAALAKEIGSPMVVSAENVEELSKLAAAAKDKGVLDIVLDSTRPTLGQELVDLTIMRRMAIKSSFRALGYPTLVTSSGNDMLTAALAIPKYG